MTKNQKARGCTRGARARGLFFVSRNFRPMKNRWRHHDVLVVDHLRQRKIVRCRRVVEDDGTTQHVLPLQHKVAWEVVISPPSARVDRMALKATLE